VSAQKKRIWIWSVVLGVVVVGLVAAFLPRAEPVDVAAVAYGPMLVTVGDEGETRIPDVFVVSAPANGRLRRIEAEPGDTLLANATMIAEIEPADADLLDPRTEAEATAQLSVAESAEELARSNLERAEAELRFAESEVRRSRELATSGTIAERDLEAAERAFRTSRAALGVAHADLEMRRFELARAKAHLMSPAEMSDSRLACECISISSPVDGKVLRVHRESAGYVRAGEPLVDIGNPSQLEVVVDLLSTDAVKIRPGDRALIENWGGGEVLDARVRLVEPFAFTKISALGIEEQRVNVVLDIVAGDSNDHALGHGYKVDVRVVLWEAAEALKVPITALFRDGDRWAVFVDVGGRARLRLVDVGHMTATEAEVLGGLEEADRIVVYPGEGVGEGTRIVER